LRSGSLSCAQVSGGCRRYDAPMAKRTKVVASKHAAQAAKDAVSAPPGILTDRMTNHATNHATGHATDRVTDRRIAWLDRMRPFRARFERDVSMDGALHSLERQLRERQNAFGDVIEAWNQIAPPTVRDTTVINGLANGTLTLATSGSSASYELSRILRDGLERALIHRFPTRIKRVKVRIGSGDA
ncbi:MAG: hypothetical protein RLY72_230, partial [Planctomycetota bacterium]